MQSWRRFCRRNPGSAAERGRPPRGGVNTRRRRPGPAAGPRAEPAPRTPGPGPSPPASPAQGQAPGGCARLCPRRWWERTRHPPRPAPPGPAQGGRTGLRASPLPRPRGRTRGPPPLGAQPGPATRPRPLRPAPRGARCRRRGAVCAPHPPGQCITGAARSPSSASVEVPTARPRGAPGRARWVRGCALERGAPARRAGDPSLAPWLREAPRGPGSSPPPQRQPEASAYLPRAADELGRLGRRLPGARALGASLEGGRRGAVGAPRLLTARTLHFPLCFLFTCNRKNNRSSCCLICSPALPTSPDSPPPRLRLEGITPGASGSCACPSSKQVHMHTKENGQ